MLYAALKRRSSTVLRECVVRQDLEMAPQESVVLRAWKFQACEL